VITDPSPDNDDGSQRAIHFQEWWVRYRAQVPTHSFAFVGADKASAGPGVVEAITGADVVFLAPSNPVVSIGAILAIPGIRAALRSTTAPVVGCSPIIDGKPLRGMADECLTVIGVETTSEAVGRHYGARSTTGLLDGWLIHEGDRADIDGVAVRSIPLLMTDPRTTAAMVRGGLELAGLATGAL
jgi:LPPG:FO 2-phospho-L-lactate transferase